MGKSGKILAVPRDDAYATLHINHKNGKKRSSKTRVAKKLAKIAKFNVKAKVQLKFERNQDSKKITKSRATKRRLKSMEGGIKTPAEECDASNEADCVVFEIGEEKQKQKEDEEEKQKQEGQKEWAKRRKERKRWVELVKDYGFKLAHQMLADEKEEEDGDVFYNSDGESVLFDDMEPVQ